MVFYKMSVLEEEKKPYFKGEKSTKKGYMYSRGKSIMIKVYTEVLGFNNLMYRYMSLPNSLSLADLAYYTLASYLSEEYADFVIEVNGIPFVCPNCEDEQFNKLPCASSIQPDFKEGDTFKMVYDLEEPFEIEIQVEKVDDIEEDACVINGRGFAIWDGFKEFQDYYYQSMELFKEYVEANEMSISDFPVDEDLDIVELNKVLEYNFEELKDVYEGE